MTKPDRLTVEEVELATNHTHPDFAKIAKQLLDTMRELEYYKKLSMDLATGAAQPSGTQSQYHPSKESEHG